MSEPEFEDILISLLKNRYKPYAGALATFAFHQRDNPRFITCRWEFADERCEPRGLHSYPTVLLGEVWHDGEEALPNLLSIVRGDTPLVDGMPLTPLPHLHDQGQSYGAYTYSGWPERSFTDYVNSVSAPWGPVIHPEFRPYSSGQIALADWVWKGAGRSMTGDPPYVGTFLVLLPDSRGRIQQAEWLGSRIRVTCDYNASRSSMTLQAVVDEKTADPRILDSQPVSETVEWEVLPGDNEAEIYLVHDDATILGHVRLTSGAHVSARAGGLTLVEQAEADLRAGEGDEIEYKPFIDIKDSKEREVIETIIAFANTRGGRLYVGVDDEGVPQESAKLRKAGKGDIGSALNSLMSRVRELARERIKPVPQIGVQSLTVFGAELILVDVAKGNSRPYSSINHDVFIRKGASNLRPDPVSELPSLYETPSAGSQLSHRSR